MLDAFTSKEMVCFNTRVLDEHLPRKPSTCSRIIVLEPKFAGEDIAREQSVVLEEIRMTQDNPEDLVHELFTQNFWQPHALGQADSRHAGNGVGVHARHAAELVSPVLRAESSGHHRRGTS